MKCIYMIYNLVNGKSYIGSTSNFLKRKKQHLEMLEKGNHHSYKLQRAYNKGELKEFEFRILEKLLPTATKKELFLREQFYMNSLLLANVPNSVVFKNRSYNVLKEAGKRRNKKRPLGVRVFKKKRIRKVKITKRKI